MKEKVITIGLIIISIIMLITLTGCGIGDEILLEDSVKLYGAAQEATQHIDEMKNQEIQMINNMFTVYEGECAGIKIDTLLEMVITHNETYKDEEDMIITVVFEDLSFDNYKDSTSIIKNIKSKIRAGSKYNVSLEKNKDGIISKINIIKN